MEKLNVIIADDEENALEILSSLLLDTQKVNILKQIANPIYVESSILSLKPDAVFLDIQMPGYDGIDLLKNLRAYQPGLPVVYVSAHKKFAMEAVKLNAFSYLLKPVSREELCSTINQLFEYKKNLEKRNTKPNKQIKLPIKSGMVFLAPAEILSLMAESNYTEINLVNGKSYTSSYNLGKLHEKLPTNQFERINRSTIVNMDYLKEVNRREKYCTIIAGDIIAKYSVSSTFLYSIGKES